MCVGTLIQDCHDSFCIPLYLDSQQLIKTHKKMLKIKEETPFWVRQMNLKKNMTKFKHISILNKAREMKHLTEFE
jgi:hypothetical protein